jgi:hypothetical protein
LIILAYPLSLLIGVVRGAVDDEWQSIAWSAGVSAAVGALFLLLDGIPINFRLLLEVVPLTLASCAILGAVGAIIGLGFKALLRALRWID